MIVSREGSELSTRDLQKMVQALPQYTEQVDKISLHVEVSLLLSASYFLVECNMWCLFQREILSTIAIHMQPEKKKLFFLSFPILLVFEKVQVAA